MADARCTEAGLALSLVRVFWSQNLNVQVFQDVTLCQLLNIYQFTEA